MNPKGIIVQIPAPLVAEFLQWAREKNLHLQERHGNANVVRFRHSRRNYVGCDMPCPPGPESA